MHDTEHFISHKISNKQFVATRSFTHSRSSGNWLPTKEKPLHTNDTLAARAPNAVYSFDVVIRMTSDSSSDNTCFHAYISKSNPIVCLTVYFRRH